MGDCGDAYGAFVRFKAEKADLGRWQSRHDTSGHILADVLDNEGKDGTQRAAEEDRGRIEDVGEADDAQFEPARKICH